MKIGTFDILVLFTCVSVRGQTLPGTQPLTTDGNIAAQTVEGIDRFLTRELARAVERRQTFWKLDFSSRTAVSGEETPIAAYRKMLEKKA